MYAQVAEVYAGHIHAHTVPGCKARLLVTLFPNTWVPNGTNICLLVGCRVQTVQWLCAPILQQRFHSHYTAYGGTCLQDTSYCNNLAHPYVLLKRASSLYTLLRTHYNMLHGLLK